MRRMLTSIRNKEITLILKSCQSAEKKKKKLKISIVISDFCFSNFVENFEIPFMGPAVWVCF